MLGRRLVESAQADAPEPPREGREEMRHLILFSALGAVMGIIGAVAAWVLYHLIMIFTGFAFYRALITRTPLYPPTYSIGFMAIVIPVVGGLIVGVMAKYGTDRIRGHGIPEAMESVLKFRAQVSPRIAFFKPISAAVAVGTGGPFGAEGPIIQTAGAIGSLIGQTMDMTSAERRTLLAAGGAAGMVGIFNTPIAGVALALELLLFEFRARSLIPVIIASGVTFAMRPLLLGGNVMFQVSNVPNIKGPLDLIWFVPLGIIIGICAVLISKGLYVVEEFFDHLHVDLIFKPALGAIVLGIVAIFQPRVFGMGYSTITEILQNHFSNVTLVGLSVGKAVALIASLGAGTSGGLLAPMLMIGAAIGSGYGRGVVHLWPAAGINPGICGIVAMSSLFSAAARAPLTSFIFAFELTGDYHALAPLMIGCMVADIVARGLSSQSVMTERLVRRGLRVEQDLEPNMLSIVSVGEVMTRSVQTLAANVPLRTVLRGLLGEPIVLSLLNIYNLSGSSTVAVAAGDQVAGGNGTVPNGMHAGDGTPVANGKTHLPPAAEYVPKKGNPGTVGADGAAVLPEGLRDVWSFPVVDESGNLLGMVTRGELLAAAADSRQLDKPIRELASHAVVVAFVDESVDTALLHMLEHDYAALPVVERSAPQKIIGILSRGDVLRARLLRQAEETQRERTLVLLRRRVARKPDGTVEETVTPVVTKTPVHAKGTSSAATQGEGGLSEPRAPDPLASAEERSFDPSLSSAPTEGTSGEQDK